MITFIVGNRRKQRQVTGVIQRVASLESGVLRTDCRPRADDCWPGTTMPCMRVPLWLKITWTIWLIVWAPVYWRQYGAQNFLYFCDIGNVLIGIGLWLESALVFSWAACGLLIFQSLYTIDLVGA